MPSDAHQSAALESIAIGAAERLLADLDQAERQTRGWGDERLGERLVAAALDRSMASLAATEVWGRDNLIASNEFWRVAGPVLERGTLQWRARFKPRGYAGDFATLAMFCDRYLGDDPLGRLFDRYFQRQTAVEAVRSRTELLADALYARATDSREVPFRVASIGCGPAIDLEHGLERLDPRRRHQLTVGLLDLDEEAIEHASARLGRLIDSSRCKARRENLYRLAERSSAERLVGRCHLVLCSGFLDYLPDEQATRFLGFLWRQLEPGGALYVGNFAPHNPSRAYMEWVGNWYLLYRTAEQLHSLAAAAGIPARCRRIVSEETGVDLFLVAEKTCAGDSGPV